MNGKIMKMGWILLPLLVFSPLTLAKKPGAGNKDLVLYVSQADSTFTTINFEAYNDQSDTISRGTIEFASISFNTLARSNVDVQNPDAVVNPGCPAGAVLSFPITYSLIWSLDGDAIALDRDSGQVNALCVGPPEATGIIINLTVSDGTGPFACANGSLGVNTVGIDNQDQPEEVQDIVTSNGLSFRPTEKNKGVSRLAKPTGIINIPASCP